MVLASESALRGKFTRENRFLDDFKSAPESSTRKANFGVCVIVSLNTSGVIAKTCALTFTKID